MVLGEKGEKRGFLHVKPKLYSLNLPSGCYVAIIAMMHPRILRTALVWLAALALAAQSFGAGSLLEACQCQACQCAPEQASAKSCCGSHATGSVQNAPPQNRCGQSCCRMVADDCARVAPPIGSCCCEAADTSVPANQPQSAKPASEKPLPVATPAFLAADV
ncbi:MAG TPA: hypothetical protein VFW62_12865, partial [bacterium]|nr:hypothetical protein [bacterium]